MRAKHNFHVGIGAGTRRKRSNFNIQIEYDFYSISSPGHGGEDKLGNVRFQRVGFNRKFTGGERLLEKLDVATNQQTHSQYH